MEILKLLRLQWDRTVALIAALVGALALLLGYLGVSGTPHVAEQLPYFISGGFFGIFMLGIGSVAWLTADLRDEWRELHALRKLFEDDMAHQANGSGSYSSEAGFDHASAPTTSLPLN